MEEFFRAFTYWGVSVVELAAAFVIAIASLKAIFESILFYFGKSSLVGSIEKIRLQLARWLSLGLEFALAADIMRTGLNPSWNEIGQLAAIAILRTALNYFIQKEIEYAIEHQGVEEHPS